MDKCLLIRTQNGMAIKPLQSVHEIAKDEKTNLYSVSYFGGVLPKVLGITIMDNENEARLAMVEGVFGNKTNEPSDDTPPQQCKYLIRHKPTGKFVGGSYGLVEEQSMALRFTINLASRWISDLRGSGNLQVSYSDYGIVKFSGPWDEQFYVSMSTGCCDGGVNYHSSLHPQWTYDTNKAEKYSFSKALSIFMSQLALNPSRHNLEIGLVRELSKGGAECQPQHYNEDTLSNS